MRKTNKVIEEKIRKLVNRSGVSTDRFKEIEVRSEWLSVRFNDEINGRLINQMMRNGFEVNGIRQYGNDILIVFRLPDFLLR